MIAGAILVACLWLDGGPAVTASAALEWDLEGAELAAGVAVEREVCAGPEVCAWVEVDRRPCLVESYDDGSSARICPGAAALLRLLNPSEIPTRIRARPVLPDGTVGAGVSNALEAPCLPCYRTGPPWEPCP